MTTEIVCGGPVVLFQTQHGLKFVNYCPETGVVTAEDGKTYQMMHTTTPRYYGFLYQNANGTYVLSPVARWLSTPSSIHGKGVETSPPIPQSPDTNSDDESRNSDGPYDEENDEDHEQ